MVRTVQEEFSASAWSGAVWRQILCVLRDSPYNYTHGVLFASRRGWEGMLALNYYASWGARQAAMSANGDSSMSWTGPARSRGGSAARFKSTDRLLLPVIVRAGEERDRPFPVFASIYMCSQMGGRRRLS